MTSSGIFRFRLDELLAERGWSAYRLAKETGIHANTIGGYRNNTVKQPNLKDLATICSVLKCGAGDLLEYVPVAPVKPKRAAKKR